MNNSNKKVLVTGAAGFIGSNIVRTFLDRGFIVRGIDNFSTGHRSNIQDLLSNKKFEFVEGDICHRNLCIDICSDMFYVLHQAALGSVPKSIIYPDIYVQNNIVGFTNILDASVKNNISRLVFASSSSVYGGDDDELPKKESQIGFPLSPYALTKRTNEDYAKLYSEIYGLKTIALRYFNVFGKYQDPYSDYAAVIPKFVKNIILDETSIIYGDGKQIRDFTYVENVVEANYLACLASEKSCGLAYNISGSNPISINKLYKLISSILNKTVPVKYENKRQGDVRDSFANINFANINLGYSPKISLENGLRQTIEWYKQYINK